MAKPGYLYVLRHPSDPFLVKVGKTTLPPERRLAQHNRNFNSEAGKIVQETGQEWTLEQFIEVPDTSYAEKAFWQAAHPAPFRGKIEVMLMGDGWVEVGLAAARNAGVRPDPKPRDKPIRNREWMNGQLEGTNLAMIGHYRGLQTQVEFECMGGHTFKASPGLVANMKYCPFCEGEWYPAYKV
ncbi:GIY-YIG nuclease family protein [Lentisalinibacter sediminis]|uniref:GIY-YIG nuclease family protein n=1 Tax=Lentisalinibacter sediminis TaxID=2992237 RepID=UPI00386E8306